MPPALQYGKRKSAEPVVRHSADGSHDDGPKSVRHAMTSREELSGPYVNLSINNTPVSLLVDTGSNCSTITSQVYEKLQDKPPLKSSSQPITVANGDEVSCLGYADFKIQGGDTQVMHRLCVSDIEAGCLIGWDFVTSQKCQIDGDQMILKLNDESLPLMKYEEPLTCFRVAEASAVKSSPENGMKVQGKVHSRTGTGRWASGSYPESVQDVDVRLKDGSPRGDVCQGKVLEKSQDLRIGPEVTEIKANTVRVSTVGELVPCDLVQDRQVLGAGSRSDACFGKILKKSTSSEEVMTQPRASTVGVGTVREGPSDELTQVPPGDSTKDSHDRSCEDNQGLLSAEGSTSWNGEDSTNDRIQEQPDDKNVAHMSGDVSQNDTRTHSMSHTQENHKHEVYTSYSEGMNDERPVKIPPRVLRPMAFSMFRGGGREATQMTRPEKRKAEDKMEQRLLYNESAVSST